MKSPIISIIVPVYKVEKYLRQCLDSIQNQTFKDWECILVDDGSPDNCGQICDEYAERDSRFRVIHRENGGLSRARNSALHVARGEYIGFVDSDDWVEPEMFQHLYNLIIENDADIAMIGYFSEFVNWSHSRHSRRSISIIDGDTALLELRRDRIPNYVWSKLQHKSIINCDFPDGRNFEDIYVYSRWFSNVKKMVIDSTPLYHYRMRRGSITSAEPAKNHFDYFLSSIDKINMIPEDDRDEAYILQSNIFINHAAVHACKIIARYESDVEKRMDAIERISKMVREYPLPDASKMGIKKWWRAKTLRDNPNFFTQLMRLVYIFDFDTKRRIRKLYN